MTIPILGRPGGLGSILGATPPESLLRSLANSLRIPEKRKIFVSYHHHRDQFYYDELARLVDDCDFLQDRSVDRLIDSNDVEYQERRIREEFIRGTAATIALVGVETYQRKFVDWELYATLYLEHGLIGILLPYFSPPSNTGKFIVPDRLHENIESGYALWKRWNELAGAANPAAVLRLWIEEAIAKNGWLRRNSGPKKAANG